MVMTIVLEKAASASGYELHPPSREEEDEEQLVKAERDFAESH